MTQIRTAKIIASNGCTAPVNVIFEKKSEYFFQLLPDYCELRQAAAAITESPSHTSDLIIITHSYPPQHDAATHLCHMMINNAPVRGAMISH